MKPYTELDHYELLEVPREASGAELERAYRLALETYGEDSLAGYSVFAPGDVAAVRERMQAAYRVLADDESRRAYDAACGLPERAPRPSRPARIDPEEPVDLALEEPEECGPDWNGPRLRRQRLRRGLELDDISASTKVNPLYLEYIERERFAELPARVYVRGFVRAYAECLGLDAETVARSYVKRYEDGRRPARRR